MIRPYVPSGKSARLALPMLLGAVLGAGLLGGVVEGVVSRWFNLLLIFPLCLGLAVGGAAMWVVRQRKVRSPLPAAGLAALGALLAQVVVHEVGYLSTRAEIAENLERAPEMSELVATRGMSAVVDMVLVGEQSGPPFIAYLDRSAANGITITNHGSSSSSSPTLTGAGVVVLWALEFLVAIATAVVITWKQARAPFCEACDGWYDDGRDVAVGAGGKEAVKQARARVEVLDVAGLLGQLGTADGKSAVVVSVKRCARNCAAHEPLLELKSCQALNTNKPKVKVVVATLLTPMQAQQLLAPAAPQAGAR
ncbi:MAG: hypothetical protein IPJ65_20785 [Archangiaceae bacterium]|nr:hypothetical protein [Archangiaceae bacterium]